MNALQIHYCLKSPGGPYAEVSEYLKGFNAWAHVHESLWFVRTNKTAATVRDELDAIIRAGDRVIVLNVTGDGWATTFTDDVTDWMHNNMKSRVAA